MFSQLRNVASVCAGAFIALGAWSGSAVAQNLGSSADGTKILADNRICWQENFYFDPRYSQRWPQWRDAAQLRDQIRFSGGIAYWNGNVLTVKTFGGREVRWIRMPCIGDLAPPVRAGARIEIGITAGISGSNQDLLINTDFDASARGSGMDSTRSVGFDARFRVPTGGGWSVFGGYRYTSYTNSKGQLILDFHPTPGADTVLQFSPDHASTFYGGVGIPIVLPNTVPQIDEAALDFFTGYKHTISRMKGYINETGGGGEVNVINFDVRQSGIVFGGELNVQTRPFGVPVVFGIGVEVAKLNGASFGNTSTLNLNYNSIVEDRTEVTVYGRVAIPIVLMPPPAP